MSQVVVHWSNKLGGYRLKSLENLKKLYIEIFCFWYLVQTHINRFKRKAGFMQRECEHCSTVVRHPRSRSEEITSFAPLSPNSSLQKSRISSTPFRLKCHPLHLLVNIPIVHSQVTQSRISHQSHQMRYPSFFSLLPPNPPVKILYPLHL